MLPEATAMVVSTTADGDRARVRSCSRRSEGGFIFFTNYGSRKAAEMAGSSYVALLFGWYPLQRQVRVEGRAERVARWESRPTSPAARADSQLGAWASSQSTEVTLEKLSASYRQAEERFAGANVPCPEQWGGYRVGRRVSSSGRASPAGCTTGWCIDVRKVWLGDRSTGALSLFAPRLYPGETPDLGGQSKMMPSDTRRD